MPIIVGNKPLFRIKFKDANIREIRRGNELEGGLYKISYINDKIDETIDAGGEENQNIPNYVGGYPAQLKENFYIYEPEDIPNEDASNADLSEYRSHVEGWYDVGDNYDETLNYIPAITRDFHRDLTLFCKGKQRQYRGSGEMVCDRYTGYG